LKTIESALNKVKRRWDVHRHFCWSGSYYQFANRLAACSVTARKLICVRLAVPGKSARILSLLKLSNERVGAAMSLTGPELFRHASDSAGRADT
jgi:hypothetical protein